MFCCNHLQEWRSDYFCTTTYTEDAANDHNFHIYKIIYNGTNNQVTFYRDGMLITTLTASSRPYDELPLLIDGRNYSNANYLDWIRVTPLG
ncbi:MAG: hypothetical protein AB1485_04525 [Candidatus Thermoplasmatota archaeon]